MQADQAQKMIVQVKTLLIVEMEKMETHIIPIKVFNGLRLKI
jgi:hypothetical protein